MGASTILHHSPRALFEQHTGNESKFTISGSQIYGSKLPPLPTGLHSPAVRWNRLKGSRFVILRTMGLSCLVIDHQAPPMTPYQLQHTGKGLRSEIHVSKLPKHLSMGCPRPPQPLRLPTRPTEHPLGPMKACRAITPSPPPPLTCSTLTSGRRGSTSGRVGHIRCIGGRAPNASNARGDICAWVTDEATRCILAVLGLIASGSAS